MTKAIVDTSPPLHLFEINHLALLSIFERLMMPNFVASELERYGVNQAVFAQYQLQVHIHHVADADWQTVHSARIQPADAQVFIVAQQHHFADVVLTDDLALRQQLEQQTATVVGTVGIMIRAYIQGVLTRDQLEVAIDALCTVSTLHLSRPFRAYLRERLSTLP